MVAGGPLVAGGTTGAEKAKIGGALGDGKINLGAAGKSQPIVVRRQRG